MNAVLAMTAMRLPSPPERHGALGLRPWRWLAGALGLAVWMGWAMLVARLPELGARLTANQTAWLLALPLLAMACARVLGVVLPRQLAGSHWTLWAAAAQLPLAVLLGTVAEHVGTPFEALVLLALGVGSSVALFAAALAPFSSVLAQQAPMLQQRETWVLCWLAAGGFGSLLGLLAALPWLAAVLGIGAHEGVWIAPLLAVAGHGGGLLLARAIGAWRVAVGAFALCALLAAAVAWTASSMPALLGLMAAAAVASGSTFHTVAERHRHDAAGPSGALSLVAGLGAFGGFVLPKALGSALAWAGTLSPALTLFAAFYLSCALLAHFGTYGKSTP
jgi:MFS transporter, NNP family, nitrate/nitrite transporter